MQERKITKTINKKRCHGTKFQLAVWTEIARIKSGTTKLPTIPSTTNFLMNEFDLNF